jgi:hypothetical protein
MVFVSFSEQHHQDSWRIYCQLSDDFMSDQNEIPVSGFNVLGGSEVNGNGVCLYYFSGEVRPWVVQSCVLALGSPFILGMHHSRGIKQWSSRRNDGKQYFSPSLCEDSKWYFGL